MFAKITTEIWLSILSNLEAKDLVRVSGVNKKLNQTSKNPELWKKECSKLNIKLSPEMDPLESYKNSFHTTDGNNPYFIVGKDMHLDDEISESEYERAFPLQNNEYKVFLCQKDAQKYADSGKYFHYGVLSSCPTVFKVNLTAKHRRYFIENEDVVIKNMRGESLQEKVKFITVNSRYIEKLVSVKIDDHKEIPLNKKQPFFLI